MQIIIPANVAATFGLEETPVPVVINGLAIVVVLVEPTAQNLSVLIEFFTYIRQENDRLYYICDEDEPERSIQVPDLGGSQDYEEWMRRLCDE